MLIALILSGCAVEPSADVAPAAADPPPVRVAAAPPGPLVGLPPPRDAAEIALQNTPLARRYAAMEARLRAGGGMRTDRRPADAPFGPEDLAANFERIALMDEYVLVAGRQIRRETPALLRRWEAPVQVAAMAAPGLPAARAAADRDAIRATLPILAAATGHPVGLAPDPTAANLLVLSVIEEGRADFLASVAETVPWFDPTLVAGFDAAPASTLCLTYAFSMPPAPSVYVAAVVLIRGELPEATRRACVEEELGQAMGLPNDSPDARPSIFNDDGEFAVLTDHDLALLRMLYDPRLEPGMTAAAARPLLPAIARDAIAATGPALVAMN